MSKNNNRLAIKKIARPENELQIYRFFYTLNRDRVVFCIYNLMSRYAKKVVTCFDNPIKYYFSWKQRKTSHSIAR